jgi:hypothetical protein
MISPYTIAIPSKMCWTPFQMATKRTSHDADMKPPASQSSPLPSGLKLGDFDSLILATRLIETCVDSGFDIVAQCAAIEVCVTIIKEIDIRKHIKDAENDELGVDHSED